MSVEASNVVATMKQALEALYSDDIDLQSWAKTNLMKAIEQAQKQSTECVEPVAWAGVDFDINTAPPKREWVGLTDKEINNYLESEWVGYSGYRDCFKDVIEWTNAKLKEKNT